MPSYRIIINFTAVGMMVDVQSKRLVTWHNARCMLDSPVNEWMSQSDSVTDTSPLPNFFFFLCAMHPLPNDWHLKYRPVCRFTARLHCVSKNAPTLKRYSAYSCISKLQRSILTIFGKNTQNQKTPD